MDFSLCSNIGYKQTNAQYTVQLSGFYFIDINLIVNKNMTTVPTYDLFVQQSRNGTITKLHEVCYNKIIHEMRTR